jgi:hypothetical protein
LIRSLQLQLLSWLAALATLGAYTKGTLDAGLFAAAMVLGTLLFQARERLLGAPSPRGRRWVGDFLGATCAWGVVLLFRTQGAAARFPARLTLAALVVAALIPTFVFVSGRVARLVLARTRQP